MTFTNRQRIYWNRFLGYPPPKSSGANSALTGKEVALIHAAFVWCDESNLECWPTERYQTNFLVYCQRLMIELVPMSHLSIDLKFVIGNLVFMNFFLMVSGVTRIFGKRCWTWCECEYRNFPFENYEECTIHEMSRSQNNIWHPPDILSFVQEEYWYPRRLYKVPLASIQINKWSMNFVKSPNNL